MRITAIFALMTVVTACSVHPTNARAEACPPPNALILRVGKYEMDLQDKRPICVTVPGTFAIKIVNPAGSGISIDPGDVTVKEKQGINVTIEGSNSGTTNKLDVVISGTADIDDEFDFLIAVEGVGILDPKVRVVDGNILRQFQHAEIDALIDDLGIDWETAVELNNAFGDTD